MNGAQSPVVSKKNNRYFDYAEVAEKIKIIREWISGPGEKLLSSQNAKPYNFNEAVVIRKAHEQFEFKCMKALEDFAILCEFRKQNSPSTELTELDFLVQNYVDRLNKRTFFVVSCFSYFKLMEELWELLEDLQKRSREVDTYDLSSIAHSINGIESGLEKVEARLSSLAHELERLKVILVPTDAGYLGQLENAFNDACKTASERMQDMRLQKLILRKHSKLLECENNVQESVGWIEELLDNVELLYQENSVGKNQLEAAELLEKCGDIYKQAKTTYAYSSQLLETYSKLCEADGRKVPRTIGSCKNRLVRVWPRLQHRLREFRERTEAAESVYTNSDMLLKQVQEYLLNATRSPVAFDRACDSLNEDVQVFTDELNRKQLNSLVEEFQNTKTLALALLDRLSRGLLQDDSEFTGPVMEEVSRLMRLRLYTLWLKLREYEAIVLGYNTADSTTATELGMDTIRPLARSRSAASTVRHHESSFGGMNEFVNSSFHSPSPFESGRQRPDWNKPERDLSRPSEQRSGRNSRNRSTHSISPSVTQPSIKADTDSLYQASEIQPITVQQNATARRPSTEARAEPTFSAPNEVAQHLNTVLKQLDTRLKAMKPDADSAFDEVCRQQLRTDAERELVRLENQVNDALNTAQHPPAATLKDKAEKILAQGRRVHRKWLRDWETWTPTILDSKDMQRIRVRELEIDLSECQNRLYDLINAVCLTAAQNAEAARSKEQSTFGGSTIPDVLTDEDIKRISMVCEETQGMGETIPAQEEFISNLLNSCRPAQHLQSEVENVQNLWKRYEKNLSSFDEFANCLERGYLLLVRMKKFITRRDDCLKDLKNSLHELPNLQADGRILKNDISQFLTSGLLQSTAAQVTQLTKAKPSCSWLINQLTQDLDQIKEAVEELDMLAANIRAGSSQDNVDLTAMMPTSRNSTKSDQQTLETLDHRVDTLRTPSLSRIMPSAGVSGDLTPLPAESHEMPPPLPPRLGKLPMHGESVRDTLKAPSTQTLSRSSTWTKHSDMADSCAPWRITHPLNDVSCKADEEAVLRCEFAGPSDTRSFNVSWTFRPFVYTQDGLKVGQKARVPKGPSEVVEEVGIDFAQLLFKSVNPTRNGYYTIRIKNVKTGNAMKSSAKMIVRPYLISELHDITVPIVDPKIGRLGTVKFSVSFRGFTCTPRVIWNYDGERLDPTLWQIMNENDTSSIVCNAAKISDQGLYECRLFDPQTGFELVSTGELKVDKVREPSPHVPLSIGVAKLGEPLAIRCPLPEGINVNVCEIDWLHNNQTIYTYHPRLLASSRNASISSRPGSRDNTFQCNETSWRTYVADGCCVLTTSCVHQTDSGDYTCRIHTADDIFESSGQFIVCETLEFVEPLQSTDVQHGQPLMLHCRLNRSVEATQHSTSDDLQEESHPALTVEWYLNDEYLNPYKCVRLGVAIQSAKDTLSLIVSKATGDHAGLYRCKVYSNETQVETQCTVNLQAVVAPKIKKHERKPQGRLQVGQTVTISVQFEVDSLIICRWTYENQPIDHKRIQAEESTGPDHCELILRNLQPEHSGLYKLTISNPAGSVEINEHIFVEEVTETDSIRLEIPGSDSTVHQDFLSSSSSAPKESTNGPEIFLISPTNIVAMAGETVKILCVISLLDNCYSVNWSCGDTVLVAGNQFRMCNGYPREGMFSLEIGNLQPQHSGKYTVTVVRINTGTNTPQSVTVAETDFCITVSESRSSPRPTSPSHRAPYILDKKEKRKHVFVEQGDELSFWYAIGGKPTPDYCWIKDKTELVRPEEGKVAIIYTNSHYGLTIFATDLTDAGLWELICYNPYNFLVLSRNVSIARHRTETPDGRKPLESSTAPDQIPTSMTSSVAMAWAPSLKTIPSKESTDGVQRTSTAIMVKGKDETRPPEFRTIFTDITCRTGETIKLTCRVDGCPTPSVKWSFGGKSIDSFGKRYRQEKRGDEYTLVIEEASPKDSGRYFLTAENVVGLTTCSGNLLVRQGSVTRSLSPLSEPGFYTYTPAHVDWSNGSPINGRSRRHSGTQTPTNQRVEMVRSVAASHLEDHPPRKKSVVPECPYCRHIVEPCSRHSFHESSVLDHSIVRTVKHRHGTRSRIRRSHNGTSRLSRHRSEDSIIPVCSHYPTNMRPSGAVTPSPYSALYDDDSVYFVNLPSIYATIPRQYTRPPPRRVVSSFEQSQSTRLRPRANSVIYPRTPEVPTEREIPIRLVDKRVKPADQDKTPVAEKEEMAVIPVTRTRPRGIPLSDAAEKRLESQFSTVESSECE